MVGKSWPTGIRPWGNGIQIRIYRKGRPEYTETLEGDPHSKADLASAIKRREFLLSRAKLGLPLVQEDPAQRQLFEVVAQDYLNTLDAKRSTQLSYENILNGRWIPAFAGWPLDEITTAVIKRELANMAVSQKTKRNILIPLVGVLDHAEIVPNPARGIRLKRHQKEEIDRYTPEERDKLLSRLDGQSKVYFSVLFGCGLRPGEALALQWTDYNGEELDVSKQITRRRLEHTTKTSVRRRVYVPEWVRIQLNNHHTRFVGEWVFVNSLGRCNLDTDIFNEAWREAHKKARIPYRIPYACRHSRASELLSIGIPPAEAAKQMGHSVEMFLRTYARWIEQFSGNQDKSRLEGVPIAPNRTKTGLDRP